MQGNGEGELIEVGKVAVGQVFRDGTLSSLHGIAPKRSIA